MINVPTVAVMVQKGGCGKTTTAFALTQYLARHRRVLLIDLDVQDSITDTLGVSRTVDKSVFDLMTDPDVSWRDCILSAGAYDVMPADKRLAKFDMFLAKARIPRPEELLKRKLESLTGYDAVVIDTAPALSMQHQNAFAVASDVLLPTVMDKLSFRAIKNVVEGLREFKESHGYGPTVAGILPNKFVANEVIERELMAVCRYAFEAFHVYEPVRLNTKLKQALSVDKGDIYKRKGAGAKDYEAFCAAFVKARWPQLLEAVYQGATSAVN